MKISSMIFAAFFAVMLSFSASASACNSSDDDQNSSADTESFPDDTLARIRNEINEE